MTEISTATNYFSRCSAPRCAKCHVIRVYDTNLFSSEFLPPFALHLLLQPVQL